MMPQSDNLDLPFIESAQAQKHITHNDAVQILDAIVQLSVIDRNLSSPPASPADGARYVVAASATGLWSGKETQVAVFQNGGWVFLAPVVGWRTWVEDEQMILVWDGAGWTTPFNSSGFALLGVNATANATNRISVSSPNSLFSHEGNDHRLVINKAGVSNNASVLFQTNWSGRAEFGLAGDDNFHIKVSPDGSAWSEAVQIDDDTANIGIGTAPSGAKMEILSAGTATEIFQVLAATASGKFSLSEAGDGEVYLRIFDKVGDERVRFLADDDCFFDCFGGLGVKTKTPTTDLHVDGTFRVGDYTVAGAPSASIAGAGAIIYITNEAGGATLAASDGTNWRRSTDNSIVSA